ncbi:MAG: hypothetical protein GY756_21855 [bacterium]|nr:hypothetical protein [bacterium]
MKEEFLINRKFEEKVPNFISSTIKNARERKKNVEKEVNILDKINIIQIMDF